VPRSVGKGRRVDAGGIIAVEAWTQRRTRRGSFSSLEEEECPAEQQARDEDHQHLDGWVKLQEEFFGSHFGRC